MRNVPIKYHPQHYHPYWNVAIVKRHVQTRTVVTAIIMMTIIITMLNIGKMIKNCMKKRWHRHSSNYNHRHNHKIHKNQMLYSTMKHWWDGRTMKRVVIIPVWHPIWNHPNQAEQNYHTIHWKRSYWHGNNVYILVRPWRHWTLYDDGSMEVMKVDTCSICDPVGRSVVVVVVVTMITSIRNSLVVPPNDCFRSRAHPVGSNRKPWPGHVRADRHNTKMTCYCMNYWNHPKIDVKIDWQDCTLNRRLMNCTKPDWLQNGMKMLPQMMPCRRRRSMIKVMVSSTRPRRGTLFDDYYIYNICANDIRPKFMTLTRQWWSLEHYYNDCIQLLPFVGYQWIEHWTLFVDMSR